MVFGPYSAKLLVTFVPRTGSKNSYSPCVLNTDQRAPARHAQGVQVSASQLLLCWCWLGGACPGPWQSLGLSCSPPTLTGWHVYTCAHATRVCKGLLTADCILGAACLCYAALTDGTVVSSRGCMTPTYRRASLLRLAACSCLPPAELGKAAVQLGELLAAQADHAQAHLISKPSAKP